MRNVHRLAWALFALLAIGLLLVGPLALQGCATAPQLPPCPRFAVQWMDSTDGDRFLAMDMQNAQRFAEMLKGIAEGTCRLQPKGET